MKSHSAAAKDRMLSAECMAWVCSNWNGKQSCYSYLLQGGKIYSRILNQPWRFYYSHEVITVLLAVPTRKLLGRYFLNSTVHPVRLQKSQRRDITLPPFYRHAVIVDASPYLLFIFLNSLLCDYSSCSNEIRGRVHRIGKDPSGICPHEVWEWG